MTDQSLRYSLIISALKEFSVMLTMIPGGLYLHKASNKVRGGVSFPRHQTLSEFGETAIGHNSQ